MKAQLDKEVANDAELYDKMVCWCETNDKEKTKAIADAEASMTNLEAEEKETIQAVTMLKNAITIL